MRVTGDLTQPNNVSFCGEDRRTLFITASKGLYSVRTRTKGAGPAK